MATHPAVVTVAPQAPLEVHQFPTLHPEPGEVRVRVEWTASTPLDMHEADGGLLVKHPQILGNSIAGTVVEVGKGIEDLQVGDEVFGFTIPRQQEKAYQIYVVIDRHRLSKLPQGVSLQAAVTVPTNLVTVFHTLTSDLKLSLPWPRPSSYTPPSSTRPILIWGASSSVGQYAIQVLKYYNYTNILATASAKHHAKLKSFGATHVFDYHAPDTVASITQLLANQSDPPLILDCIGSQSGSVVPISRIAQSPGTIVAILLPIIVRPPSSSTSEKRHIPPIYSMEVSDVASWSPNVTVKGVRTYFYERNEFYKEYLQPSIIPSLLADGSIQPNPQKVVTGATLLERAEKALELLRSGTISGEKLVWRVWTAEEFPEFA